MYRVMEKRSPWLSMPETIPSNCPSLSRGAASGGLPVSRAHSCGQALRWAMRKAAMRAACGLEAETSTARPPTL